MIKLDTWQEEILETKGNIVLCSGRQVGKSTIVSISAGEFAATERSKSILIISSTERQAEEMFNKVLYYIDDNYPRMIMKGKDRPTKHVLKLTNGSIIRCLPTGLAGVGIRGYTIDRLIADEAAFIPTDVFTAVTPMLLTTGGDIILVSTPHGKEGYFYDCYRDPNFKVFHINSEEVIRNREESISWNTTQREKALAHLEAEKKRMTQLQYAQEYLGEFVDSLRQFFSDDLIKKCMTLKRRDRIFNRDNYFMGMDIARLGEDQTTFEIIEKISEDKFEQIESIIFNKKRINETVTEAIRLDNLYQFKKIYVDDAGVGGGVFDYLLIDDQTKNKVVSINNSSRPLDRDEKRKTKIMKEDLYTNLLVLMEQGKLSLLDDDEVFLSLKSVQYEYLVKIGQPTDLRIFGNYTHIAEGLVRAAWSSRDKTLNISVYSIKI